jgi:hypothetical protein
VHELKKRSYLISGSAKVFCIIVQKIQCTSAIITSINDPIDAFASQFIPSDKKKCKTYMLYIKNWESIQYTKHGMLTLMFMKNKCSKFADSKHAGMPDSKQHTMLANLPLHFSSSCSPSVAKCISSNLFLGWLFFTYLLTPSRRL